MKTFLRMGSDYLDDAREFNTQADAVDHFRSTAKQLARYGQTIEASLHFAPSRELVAEYPDRTLSLGPRGGVQVERV